MKFKDQILPSAAMVVFYQSHRDYTSLIKSRIWHIYLSNILSCYKDEIYIKRNKQKKDKTTVSSVASSLLEVAEVFFINLQFCSLTGFIYFYLKISENLLCILNKVASSPPFKCDIQSTEKFKQ